MRRTAAQFLCEKIYKFAKNANFSENQVRKTQKIDKNMSVFDLVSV